MDTGRLGLVRKRSDYQRKYMFMMNECMKARWQMYDGFLDHEKQSTSYKRQCELGGIRQSVVKQKVLQKCLKMRRDGVKESDLPPEYGDYGGLPVNALAKDIDNYIAFMHPKLRRLRNVKRNLKESVDTGAIINSANISRRIRRLFRENTIKKSARPHKTNKYSDEDKEFQCTFPDITPRRNGLHEQSSQLLSRDNNQKTVASKPEPLLNQSKKPNPQSSFSTPRPLPSINNTPRSEISHTDTSRSEKRNKKQNIVSNNKSRLILPPIKATKSMVKR